jgi:hypothetical protein
MAMAVTLTLAAKAALGLSRNDCGNLTAVAEYFGDQHPDSGSSLPSRSRKLIVSPIWRKRLAEAWSQAGHGREGKKPHFRD